MQVIYILFFDNEKLKKKKKKVLIKVKRKIEGQYWAIVG